MIQAALAQLIDGRDLSRDQAREVMNGIMSGDATPAQIAGFLVALRVKGESADEIAGCAEAMREHVLRISPARSDLVDTAGTGGDGSNTFNISTAAALVAAAAGAGVAKHGNRAASSSTGAADVLEALGFDLALPPRRIEQSIDELGFGFLFAPAHHPAMRHAAPVRRELAARTVFNVLGPLTNPAGARAQVVGVYAPGRRPHDRRCARSAGRAAGLRRARRRGDRRAVAGRPEPRLRGGARPRARVRARPGVARHPALRPGRAARRRRGDERRGPPRRARGRRRRPPVGRAAERRRRRRRRAAMPPTSARASPSPRRRSTRAPPPSDSTGWSRSRDPRWPDEPCLREPCPGASHPHRSCHSFLAEL